VQLSGMQLRHLSGYVHQLWRGSTSASRGGGCSASAAAGYQPYLASIHQLASVRKLLAWRNVA